MFSNDKSDKTKIYEILRDFDCRIKEVESMLAEVMKRVHTLSDHNQLKMSEEILKSEALGLTSTDALIKTEADNDDSYSWSLNHCSALINTDKMADKDRRTQRRIHNPMNKYSEKDKQLAKK